jgi:hypothetical protein
MRWLRSPEVEALKAPPVRWSQWARSWVLVGTVVGTWSLAK